MSLRLRTAVALATLAVAAASAVGVVAYRATAERLRTEMDRSLVEYGRQLTEPSATLANQLCRSVQAEPFTDDNQRTLLYQLPGSRVQCLGADGTILAQSYDGALPVTRTDIRIAAGVTTSGTIRTVTTGATEFRLVTVPVNGGAIQIARSTAENGLVLAGLRTRAVIVLAIVAAAAAAAGWWLARRLVAPVVTLTEVTERFGDDGRFDITVPTAGQDEIGRLTRAFAAMADRLRTSRRQQQELVQNAGHELRTPLTSLRANIDTLIRHPELAGPDRDALLADLRSELEQLTSLTNELVDLAAETPTDRTVEPVRIDELTRRCVDRAARRSHRSITCQTEPVTIQGDPRQLSRMIDNLLDNALKFSDEPDPVSVWVTGDALIVKDAGPGFESTDLSLVFERFYRSPAARSVPGSGLGLSIVAQIAEQHGATVRAWNDPAGGAVVAVALPTLPPGSVDQLLGSVPQL